MSLQQQLGTRREPESELPARRMDDEEVIALTLRFYRYVSSLRVLEKSNRSVVRHCAYKPLARHTAGLTSAYRESCSPCMMPCTVWRFGFIMR
jgi:hypothetical protein